VLRISDFDKDWTSTRMKPSNYLGHAAVYSLTNGLMQVGGLVMLTLYTHLLTPQEYGAYALLTRLAETVSMILLVGGFRQAFLTFYQQGDSDLDRQRVLTGTYTFFGVAGTLGGLTLCAFAGPIWDLLGVGEPGGMLSGASLLRLAFVSVLIDPFCIVPLVLFQVRLESRRYFLVSVVRLLLRIVVCTLLMLALGLGVGGALLGTALVNGSFALLMGGRELRRGIAWPGRAQVGEMVRFALPFLPGSLCFFVLHDGDRFFLAPWGTEQIGLYDLGYRFAQLVAAFALVPLVAVWNNRMYDVAKTPEAPVVFGRVFTWILSAYLFVGLGVLLFVDEALAVMAKSSYAGAAFFTPLVLVGCGFQAAASLMDAGFYVRRRTDLKLYVTLAATAVMLAGYATLIPWLGAVGAGLATILGFAFLACVTWLTTRRIFPVRYEPGRLLGLIGLLVLAWGLGRLIPLGWATSPLKGLAWLAVPALAWGLGLISSAEKEYLRGVGRSLAARLPLSGRRSSAVQDASAG
jgi:O-antigen/teichoic acid export membrane protein